MLPAASSRRSFVQTMEQVIGTVLGLRRVFDTKVGNELIRGISGGQKKRVSIGEVLATHAKILAFDNSTRGLGERYESCKHHTFRKSHYQADYPQTPLRLETLLRRCGLVPTLLSS